MSDRKTPLARQLRRESTIAEQRLWRRLSNRQLGGLKFRRQHPVGPFVADFACPAARLIVEIDGDQHGLRRGYDAMRTARLAAHGYRVIRFGNHDVMTNMEEVLEAIHRQAVEGLRAG